MLKKYSAILQMPAKVSSDEIDPVQQKDPVKNQKQQDENYLKIFPEHIFILSCQSVGIKQKALRSKKRIARLSKDNQDSFLLIFGC